MQKKDRKNNGKMIEKSSQNGPKMESKSVKNRWKNRLRFRTCKKSPSRPTKSTFWPSATRKIIKNNCNSLHFVKITFFCQRTVFSQFWRPKVTKMRSFWLHFRSKMRSRSDPKKTKKRKRGPDVIDFGSVWRNARSSWGGKRRGVKDALPQSLETSTFARTRRWISLS